MIRKLTFAISEVAPYINWPYFDYAWGVGSKGHEEREQLHRDAALRMQKLEGRYATTALFGLFRANSDGDDLLLWPDDAAPEASPVRLPMLRQQRASHPGAPNLCLTDFVRPFHLGVSDTVGVFATTVDHAIETDTTDDPYGKMMAQTLADRLAEATAELMHLQVRRRYWGYAPDEQLDIPEMLSEHWQGIRPAVGYPSLPDVSLNFVIDRLIDMRLIGIRLTGNGAMQPHASVSGLMLAHPQARYFTVGTIGQDQLADYARRRGIPVTMMRKFLGGNIQ